MNSRLITTTALLSVLSTGLTAAPVTYDFSLTDWTNGGQLTGSFVADDLDGDGQIVSFDGEVIDFSAVYSNNDGSTTFDLSSLGTNIIVDEVSEVEDTGPTIGGLTGLVFNLDGLGTIGDSNAGAGEGLAIDNGEVFLAVGPGPEELCNGESPCGIAQTQFVPIFEENILAQTLVATLSTDNELPPVTPLFENAFVDDTAFSSIIVTTDEMDGLGNAAAFEVDALMSNETDENGGFIFRIPVFIPEGEFFFIDPEVAVGYTYEVENASFYGVKAPSIGAVNDGIYELSYVDASGTIVTTTLIAEQEIVFGLNDNVMAFTITGINPDLGIEPDDSAFFITGVALSNITGNSSITQTPITFDTDLNAVPLPASSLLLLAGIGGLVSLRRRKAA